MRLIPVLLSGGVGTRLWPVSTSRTPKQLQPLIGTRTMIQSTAVRMTGLDAEPPFVVCGAGHVEEIVAQLADVDHRPQLVLAEPVGRNTAPAVALAALAAPPEAVLVVLPSDHVVRDQEAFRVAVGQAVEAARTGRLVTFGIVPDRPETGYGYIEVASDAGGPVLTVESFVEKPDLETASRFVAGGRHVWNSGMFAFTAASAIAAFERHAPAILDLVRAALDEGRREDGIIAPGDRFGEVPSISFDHAVMENTDRAVVVPLSAGWSDVGSWDALWEVGTSDGDGNVVRGDAILLDVHRSLVRADSRTVAVVGVDDIVVVETEDAVLVVAKSRSQDVKTVFERLSHRP